jgi:hypothetical protein
VGEKEKEKERKKNERGKAEYASFKRRIINSAISSIRRLALLKRVFDSVI